MASSVPPQQSFLASFQSSFAGYRSSRRPGQIMFLTGIFHNLVPFIRPMFGQPFLEALKAGYIDQFTHSPTRGQSFWFLCVGFQCMLLGWSMIMTVSPTLYKAPSSSPKVVVVGKDEKKEENPQAGAASPVVALPRSLGWALLAFGTAGVLAYPESGFYTLFPQGLALILAH